jgi:hypothetical protein
VRLLSLEEIQHLRGEGVPPGLTEHRDSSGQHAARHISEWREIDRASRALQHIDRELRRCARAWSEAYENSSSERDESVFTSPSWVLSELAPFPTPVTVAQGRLTVTAAVAAPTLAVLLKPEDEVFAVLAQWPASSLAYALSAFGTTGEMTIHRGCAIPEQPDRSSVLAALVAISEGRRANGLSDTMDSRELRDHRVYQPRTIAESQHEAGHRASKGCGLRSTAPSRTAARI